MNAFNFHNIDSILLNFSATFYSFHLTSTGIRSEKLVNKYSSWSSILEIPLKSPHKLMRKKCRTLTNCNLHSYIDEEVIIDFNNKSKVSYNKHRLFLIVQNIRHSVASVRISGLGKVWLWLIIQGRRPRAVKMAAAVFPGLALKPE